ncbi:MAG TPA: carboxypeptidase-like regulatory domain-containing protein [Candidatus Polarisedimenticolaceae bacterium]|nr:carboxypeptidase-like regulatory domain-containing protein [Candidatus Polarisedimenticolaceae bacterium]
MRGRVVNGEGQPIPALPITGQTDHAPEARAVTDAEGRFELQGLSGGPQLLRIGDEAKEERALQRCDGSCGPARLDPDGEAGEVRLRLVEGGRICLPARPVGESSRACVGAYARPGGGLIAETQGAWGQDPVCTDPLPAGPYDVRIDCPSDGGNLWFPGVPQRDGAAPVLVRAGSRTLLALDSSPPQS